MKYLLLFLYTFQGAQLSIFQVLIPILLAEKGFTFDQQGLYSLVSYPFQLKVLFAPIIDLFYISYFGKRKSYLLPANLIIVIILMILSSVNVFENIYFLQQTGIMCCLFLGLQDVTIDALAMDTSKHTNISVALLQNIGSAVGSSLFGNFLYLCSFEQFLQLNALAGFILLITVAFKVKEKEEKVIENIDRLSGLKQVMKGLFSNKLTLQLMTLLFIERYFLATLDSTFGFKLVQLGFDKVYIFFSDIIQLPVRVGIGLFYQKYLLKYDFKYYSLIQFARIIPTICAIVSFYLIETNALTSLQSCIAIFITDFSWWILYNVTYIIKGNFLQKICTPGYEATCLVLMNSVALLGVKTSFSLSLYLANNMSYYHFLIMGLIGHTLFCILTKRQYAQLNLQPVEAWRIEGKLD